MKRKHEELSRVRVYHSNIGGATIRSMESNHSQRQEGIPGG